MFKIGNVAIKNNIVLAPMAGVSNAAYMKICEEMGLGYAVTELISAEAIVRGNEKTFDMLKGLDSLKIPFGIQLFGENENVLTKAAKYVEQHFNPSVIDINMGCPVPKVALKSGAGSALLKDPEKVYRIVEKVSSSVKTPVTVKIRSGWDCDNINAVDIAKQCEKAGAKAIAVHARTRSQGYSGIADWNVIKEVKSAVSMPVIGNGDVKTCKDALKMIKETSCDAVMIGRAALGNPWLIKECISYVEIGETLEKPNIKDRIDMIKKHYLLLKKYNNEKKALLDIRSHALWYLKGINGMKKYKNEITSCISEKDFFAVLDKIVEDFTI